VPDDRHRAPGALIRPSPAGASHARHRVFIRPSFLPHGPAQASPWRPLWMRPP